MAPTAVLGESKRKWKREYEMTTESRSRTSRSTSGSSNAGRRPRRRRGVSLPVLSLALALPTQLAPAFCQGGTRAIVVDEVTHQALAGEIQQLSTDYQAEGADVSVLVVPVNEPFGSWTAHLWVRAALAAVTDLEGAILIGNVPI